MGGCSKTYDLVHLYTRACSQFYTNSIAWTRPNWRELSVSGGGGVKGRERGRKKGEETGETGEGEGRKREKEWEG